MFKIIRKVFRRNPVFNEILALAKQKVKDIEAKYEEKTATMKKSVKAEIAKLKAEHKVKKAELAKELAKDFFVQQ